MSDSLTKKFVNIQQERKIKRISKARLPSTKARRNTLIGKKRKALRRRKENAEGNTDHSNMGVLQFKFQGHCH